MRVISILTLVIAAGCASPVSKPLAQTAPLPQGAALKFTLKRVASIAPALAQTNSVSLSFVTPGAGQWSAQLSGDFHSWLVVSSGFASGANEHVVVQRECAEGACFFRVQWFAVSAVTNVVSGVGQ